MQRVNRATAVAVLPTPPVGGTPGYFAAPDPVGGVSATSPGYEWYNAVQEELMAIIVAAGITADGAQFNQVLLAMQAIMPQFSDQTGVLSGNGWVSIPIKISGVKRNVIFQWGTLSAVAAGAVGVASFPIAYPNAVLLVTPFYFTETPGTLTVRTFNGAASTTQVSIQNTGSSPSSPSYISIGW